MATSRGVAYSQPDVSLPKAVSLARGPRELECVVGHIGLQPHALCQVLHIKGVTPSKEGRWENTCQQLAVIAPGTGTMSFRAAVVMQRQRQWLSREARSKLFLCVNLECQI